jgi:hypothetical protein
VPFITGMRTLATRERGSELNMTTAKQGDDCATSQMDSLTRWHVESCGGAWPSACEQRESDSVQQPHKAGTALRAFAPRSTSRRSRRPRRPRRSFPCRGAARSRTQHAAQRTPTQAQRRTHVDAHTREQL